MCPSAYLDDLGTRAQIAPDGLLAVSPGALHRLLITQTCLAAQVLLICLVLSVPQDFLKAHVHLFYLAHYCLFLPFFFMARDRCAFLFSPSFLIISYISISFIIGGFAFANGYVLFPAQHRAFLRWEHVGSATGYFMVCNLCAALAYYLARCGRTDQPILRMGGSLRKYAPQLVVGGVLLGVFSVVSIGLTFLGGSGDFSIVPRTFGFLAVTLVLVKSRWRFRFVAYMGMLLLFAASEFGNRRVVLLLGLSLLFMEAAHLVSLRLSFRRILTCVAVVVLAVVLQMSMTVARGLSGFEGSYWHTFSQLDRFVRLENATAYSLKTTEGPSTFFHSNNAFHYVVADPALLSYGSTLAKVFFVPIPRSIWPNKPNSMGYLYTRYWNREFFNRGGCAGVNLYAEFFWNFQALGLLCVLPLMFLLNRVFFFYLRRIREDDAWRFLYIGVGYNALLMYARGHGLDGIAVQVVFGVIVQWLLFEPLVVLLRVKASHVTICMREEARALRLCR